MPGPLLWVLKVNYRYWVFEIEQGLVDADFGGAVYKKRVPLPGKGKLVSNWLGFS
ncbi:type II toxin-antitoxin system RelE/ParE family toxin [Sansalvadorimonas verongulae]|uniref:type II toxin-antitoxin system RelE/ParE family toxin n=1 Tax=Sansalvadorimonas verongulae TaxID=2172824 RepID=UPI002E337C39|nr:type II toxin-antitoxin system RelE/ParE family toxin [Sansalvadorimonas verongulae]MTI12508.1 hypothetical protein [Sansalvadorimonas verongulae]